MWRSLTSTNTKSCCFKSAHSRLILETWKFNVIANWDISKLLGQICHLLGLLRLEPLGKSFEHYINLGQKHFSFSATLAFVNCQPESQSPEWTACLMPWEALRQRYPRFKNFAEIQNSVLCNLVYTWIRLDQIFRTDMRTRCYKYKCQGNLGKVTAKDQRHSIEQCRNAVTCRMNHIKFKRKQSKSEFWMAYSDVVT